MRKPPFILLLILLAAIVAEGCSQGSPLHRRYNNLLAYYNTYYNAEQKLEEGVRSLEQRQEAIDRTQLVSIFPSPAASGQATAFEEAIEKASELLRNRPSSKYADEALFLIGKAYFYQQNFVGAEEKFRETLLLVEEQGDARAVDESRFWLARTLSAAGAYDDGATVIRERLSNEDVDRRWRPRLQLAMGELLAQAGRYEEAVEVLQAGIEHVDDRNEGARAAFLLGQIFEELERFEEAVEAYRATEERHASYAITYSARLNRALVLGLDLERHAEALALIEEMKSDGKNYESRAEVELTYARLLAASGQTENALSRFDAVLYDEAFGGSSIRGQVHYRLAEWHRDVWQDYERAAVHFDTAGSALRTPSEASETRYTREAMLDAQEEARRFGAYAEAAGKLSEADSLLELSNLDDATFQQRIAEIEAQRRAEYVANLERRGELEARRDFGGAVVEDPTQRGIPQGEESTEVSEEAGFLGHRNQPTVESGRIAFEQTWGTRPLVPNWRRQAVLSIAQITGPGGAEVGISQTSEQGGPPPLDLSAVPRTDAGRAELEERRAELRYEQANALFLGLNLPDSARSVYLDILEETPDASAAVRARYALAEIARQEERTEVAETYYRQVADLAEDEVLRNAALERLGEQVEDQTDDDSNAGRSFDLAKRAWDAGRSEQAVRSFVAVADAFPDSEEAPRALFAAAAVLIEGISDERLESMQQPASDSMVIGLVRVPTPESVRTQRTINQVGLDAEIPEDELDVPDRIPGTPEPVTIDDVEESDVIARPDSAAQEEGVEAEHVLPVDADSTVASADSGVVATALADIGAPDSVAVSPDTSDASTEIGLTNISDSGQQGNEGDRAITVLDRLIADYPQSKAAERAGEVRSQLAQRLGLAPVEEGESVAVKTESGANVTHGLYGEAPILPEAGGYTIQVMEAPNRSRSRIALMQLRREGVRAVLARRSGGDNGFLLVVGHFETEIDAQAAAENLPAEKEMELFQREEPSVISLQGLETVEEEVEIDEEILDRSLLE